MAGAGAEQADLPVVGHELREGEQSLVGWEGGFLALEDEHERGSTRSGEDGGADGEGRMDAWIDHRALAMELVSSCWPR